MAVYLGENPIDGSIDSTSTPVANRVSKFDSNAKMNSTDMSAEDVTSFVNSLGIGTNQFVDYIVDQGLYSTAYGNIYYRKWNSGMAEIWRVTSAISYAMTSNYGSGNYYTQDYFSFPTGFFTRVDYVSVERSNITSGVGLVSTSIYYFDTTKVSFYIWNNGSTLTTSLNFSIYARGMWK